MDTTTSSIPDFPRFEDPEARFHTRHEQPPATARPNGILIDVPKLAIQLGVTERFVRRLVAEGRVPFHKIGKFVRFHPDDIDKWVSNQRVDQVNDY